MIVYDMIDDCSRVVKAKAYSEKTVENSIKFITYVLSTTSLSIRAIRTDNGSEFSRAFTEYLEGMGIKHIKNTTYTPEENGKIERYHRTWKDEDINYRSYGMSLDEANYRLKLREYHYNYKRKHR
jgi:putative transposase